jgi:hypothetical protein
MINNLIKILPLLTFEEGKFYHVCILKRKKEHPELGSNSYVVKHYFIKDEDNLMFHWGEMLALADYHNARLCINLNQRSFESLAFQTLKKVADQIMNKDFKSVRKAYTSVCGAYQHDNEKKWIIDIDTHDEGAITFATSVIALCEGVEGPRVLAVLPTRNGKHIISRPFNVAQFAEYYKQENSHEIPDIQKNNPTILYIP